VADVDRIKALVIPPAWTDVWVCPYPRGHLQAVGTDGAGRRQYLYHPAWREQRDVEKFERVTELATRLPGVRRSLRNQMRAEGDGDEVERARVLAAAVRLIDLGCFRPGSDASAADFGSHGLTTLERQHVRSRQGGLAFGFVGKAGIEHEIFVDDPDVITVVNALRKRRDPDPRLLTVAQGGRRRPITPEEVNEHIRAVTGLDITAKDIRTWHGTVTAAAALAQKPLPTSARGRAARVREAVAATSQMLGNTPTVARSSYIDPRVIDLFESGTVLDPIPGGPDGLDRAVADLLAP
jgi:DNA topoisomerase IB